MVDVTERVASADGEGYGSVGHWPGPHGKSVNDDVAEFLLRYRT